MDYTCIILVFYKNFSYFLIKNEPYFIENYIIYVYYLKHRRSISKKH